MLFAEHQGFSTLNWFEGGLTAFLSICWAFGSSDLCSLFFLEWFQFEFKNFFCGMKPQSSSFRVSFSSIFFQSDCGYFSAKRDSFQISSGSDLGQRPAKPLPESLFLRGRHHEMTGRDWVWHAG